MRISNCVARVRNGTSRRYTNAKNCEMNQVELFPDLLALLNQQVNADDLNLRRHAIAALVVVLASLKQYVEERERRKKIFVAF